MSVYVGPSKYPYGRMVMCHMVADSLIELHQMANELDLRYEWYQGPERPHYDLSMTKRAQAVELGALEVDDRRIVEALLRSEPENAIRLALAEQSACSSGAAATAASFARLQNMTSVEEIDYYTSYDVQANDSFVGYVGIGYGPLQAATPNSQ